MADHAIDRIRMLHSVAPQKPWVQYYAPGTAHAPHHAPPEWIAKFKGKFDQGWDKVREETLARQKALGVVPPDTKLTERSPGIPAWDSLDAAHKKVAARMMEVYAAALSHADYHMGRVVNAIEELGELDNTLVIYIQGDNGESAEGGPDGVLDEIMFVDVICRLVRGAGRGRRGRRCRPGRSGWCWRSEYRSRFRRWSLRKGGRSRPA